TRCNFSVVLEYEYIVFIELGNFIPVWVIIVCLNALLLRKIYKSKKKDIRAHNHQENKTAEDNQRLKAFLRELKYAKVICLTVGIYTLCMAPIIIINTLKVFVPFLNVKSTGFRVMLLFLYLCPALNPLVYGLKMSSYRKEFKRYLPCKRWI
uniref:G-protein coupled receptors family 1 profile domain-containing protein n=2 Tax=Clytia hemisphaerica TaxID=252671 RepID=A0A7M5TR23_9CNID